MISIGLSIFCSILSVIAGFFICKAYLGLMKPPDQDFETLRKSVLQYNKETTKRLEEMQKMFPVGHAVTLVREEQNNMREILNQVLQYLISLEEGKTNGSSQ